jgi:glycosyltransferase involved in cell wall biosynthesis
MRILMHERADGAAHPGGDLVQLRRWAFWLRRAGHEVLTSTDELPELAGVDLVHLNNASRAAALLPTARHCRRHGVPTLLTTLYWPAADFERRGRPGFAGWCAGRLPDGLRNRLKSGLRWWRQPCAAHWRELWLGTPRVLRELLAEVSALAAVCAAEARWLRPLTSRPIFQVPSGVDQLFAVGDSDLARAEQGRPQTGALDEEPAPERHGVLCVGRFDPQKGQHRLLAALAGLEVPVTLVGATNPNYPHYRAWCAASAGAQVRILPPQPVEELRRLYRSCQVHAQASWYELSSLSALEAAACGAHVVTTNAGGMAEYLGEAAWYTAPGDLAGLRSAVLAALATPPRPTLAERMRQHFTWEQSTRRLLAVYEQVAGQAADRRAA